MALPPRHARVLAWPVALVTGLSFGLLEGLVYSTPRVWIYAYWALLAALMLASLAGHVGLARAAALFPFVLVVQDAASLVAQGASPLTATWYADYFGRHVLTARAWLVPNWYYAGVLLSVLLYALVAHRSTRASRLAKTVSHGRASMSMR